MFVADKKRKKRKAEDSEQTYEDTKHKKQDEFTEIEFKFVLRNSNTVFSGREGVFQVSGRFGRGSFRP